MYIKYILVLLEIALDIKTIIIPLIYDLFNIDLPVHNLSEFLADTPKDDDMNSRINDLINNFRSKYIFNLFIVIKNHMILINIISIVI